RITLLVCRNALMYFNAEVQQRILERFHFGLHDGGFLFLGKAEMLLTRSNAFTPVDLKKRIFAKGTRPPFRNGAAKGPPRPTEGRLDPADGDRLRDLALQTDPNAQIVVDEARTMAVANERARILFGLTPNDIGRPFHDLEVSYRPIELRSMIDLAFTER